MDLFSFLRKKPQIQEKTSRTTILNTQYGSARWPERDYANFAKESYMKNVIAYRCILYISTSFASVEWGIYQQKGRDKKQLDQDPFLKVLSRANPQESFVAFIQRMISFYLISGNVYIEKIEAGNEVKELYVLRPDKMVIKLNDKTGIVEKYIFDNKIEFDVDPITLDSDILHVKSFHPLNDFSGFSTTEAIAREIDGSNEITEWQKKVFENEGRPGMAVFIHGFLDDQQWNRLEKQLNSNHAGKNNAGKPIVIEGESTGDIKPYAWSPKEMDWIESNRELSRRICIGYGIPPMLLGIPGDNTYCLPADTIIFTPNGNKNIIDIKQNDVVYSFNNGKLEKKKVLKSGITGNKKLYEIKTKNRTLRLTGNHPVLIRKEKIKDAPNIEKRFSKELEYYFEYVDCENLKIDDVVCQIKNLPEGNINKFNLTKEEMELFGFYYGDGYISRPVLVSENKGYKRGGRLILAIPENAEYKEYYVNIAEKITKNKAVWGIRCVSFGANELIKKMDGLNLIGNAHTKRLPDWIYNLPENLKLDFLRGIIDSDGSINDQGRMQLILCNEELIKDIWYLCISCGLQVNNISKREYISLLPNKKQIKAVSFSFLITNANDVYKIGSHTESYNKKIKNNLGKNFKEYLLTTGGKSSRIKIENLIDTNYFNFSRIKSIKELNNENVYDLEVEDNHNFIANGIVVHNSNLKEAREAFWEETIVYYLDLIKGELNNWLFDYESKRFIDYDISQTPAMMGKKDTAFNQVKDANFLTINEKRRVAGYEKIEGGDVILVGIGNMTLDQLLLQESTLANGGDESENNQENEDEEVKKLMKEGYDENTAKQIIGVEY